VTGIELIEICLQAFALGLVVGVPVGVVKSFLHNVGN